jgi:ribonuclease-3
MRIQSPLDLIKNTELRDQCLTHRSFTQELKLNLSDFERLEFLGDALLDFLIAEKLMKFYPQDPEGLLSKKRASLVNEEVLAKKSKMLGFDQKIRLGPAEARSGGAEKPSLLSNVFESVLAALYLDQGHGTASEWLESVFEQDIKALGNSEFEKDYKTRFQEWAQNILRKTPTYQTQSETGLSHLKHFHVEVTIDLEVWGEGFGTSKKKAEQKAAEMALKKAEDQMKKGSLL